MPSQHFISATEWNYLLGLLLTIQYPPDDIDHPALCHKILHEANLAIARELDRGASVYQAVDALEAMLADRVTEVDRLTAELEELRGRYDRADAVARGARSLWGSWAFHPPEAIGQMAALKIGEPLREYEENRS